MHRVTEAGGVPGEEGGEFGVRARGGRFGEVDC